MNRGLLSIFALGLAAPTAPTPSPGMVAGLIGVFAPERPAADYVVSLKVKRGYGPPGEDTEVLRRHGHWMRIDKVERGRASVNWANLADPTSVSLGRNAAGAPIGMQVSRGHEERWMDYASRSTGKVETALGQRCTVWSVYRSVPERGDPGFERFGCVTDDGIELWRRTDNQFGTLSSAVATSFERRPVAGADVRPPADLLDYTAWFGQAPASAPGVEVVLAPSQAGGAPMTVRRAAGWSYEDGSAYARAREVTSLRPDIGARVSVYFTADGTPDKLLIQHLSSAFAWTPRTEPLDRPDETVLGERCSWIDAMPGTADAGRTECRTKDGAPLKVVYASRGDQREYAAVRISRRKMARDEVLPPKALLDPRLWGLDD